MSLSGLLLVSLLAAPVPRPFTVGPSVEGVSEYGLPNGLRVLFVPDESKPTVTVNLTVLAGSRHEGYGETGMAHLLEHMVFKGTPKIPDAKKALTERGARPNGTTAFDRTNYFETLPATDANLEWALRFEADRLVNCFIAKKDLDSEMTVVRNEFEMGENDGTSVLFKRLLSTAYSWHNYGNTTIGARSDIERAPIERLQAFYKRFYQPDNAVLVVAGRFDEAKAFRIIADAFGRIPRPARKLVPTYTEEPVQDGERSVTVRRVGGTPVMMAGYHIPAGTDPDYAPVALYTAVMAQVPSGRLYQALVETKKAASVEFPDLQQAEPGYMMAIATLNEKDDPVAAKAILVDTLEQSFAKRPVTVEEVERAKAEYLKYFDTVLNASDRVGLALSEYAALGDWRMLFVYRDRLKAVTAEDVMRVAQKYVKPSNRTLGEYVPTPKPDRAEIPALVDLAPVLKAYQGGEALAKGEAFDASPATIDARTLRSILPNGLKVALLPKKTRGETVQVVLTLRYGTVKSLEGLRSVGQVTARMLTRGTRKRSRQAFQDELEKLKVNLRVGADAQAVTAAFEVRRPQLDAALELVLEALKEPALDAAELETLEREMRAELERAKDEPRVLGSIALRRAMSAYPSSHPLYAESIEEQLASLAAVDAKAVKDFHQRFYGAQAGEAVLVGDFDAKAMVATLERGLGSWKAPQAFERIVDPYQPLAATRADITTPDKAGAFLAAGLGFALRDSDPDYPGLLLANAALGGGFINGRVPRRLREKEGLSYGAGTSLTARALDANGLLIGYAIFAPENVEKVEQGLREELERAVASGFGAEELQVARDGLLQQRSQRRANDGELAQLLAQQLYLGRTMDFEAAVDRRLKAVSAGEVGALLKKYVDPAKLTFVRAGDFKSVGAPK